MKKLLIALCLILSCVSINTPVSALSPESIPKHVLFITATDIQAPEFAARMSCGDLGMAIDMYARTYRILKQINQELTIAPLTTSAPITSLHHNHDGTYSVGAQNLPARVVTLIETLASSSRYEYDLIIILTPFHHQLALGVDKYLDVNFINITPADSFELQKILTSEKIMSHLTPSRTDSRP